MKRIPIFAIAALLALPACEQSPSPTASGPVVPPADAVFLDPGTEPIHVINRSLAAARGQKGSIKSEYIGQWVPPEGWDGYVEEVNLQRGGTTIGMYYSSAGMIGGGFWVIAFVPSQDTGIEKADQIVLQGKISEIQVIIGAAPTYRIILDPCRILEQPKH